MLETFIILERIFKGKLQTETRRADEKRELIETLKAEYMEGEITADQYQQQMKSLQPTVSAKHL